MPVRFGLQANLDDGGPHAFLELARKAEDLGFHALYVADHVGITAAPFTLLAAATSVTTTLRLGTYVLNCGVRDPLSIAGDIATIDVFSGGRVILGVGAGRTPAEWTMNGMKHVPLLIGGNGTRVLQLAAQEADVVSLSGLGRTLPDGQRHTAIWSADAIERSVALVQDVGTIDALVQHVEITEDAHETATRMASRVEGLRPDDVLAAPFALVGTIDDLAEEIASHEQRWGITSYVVRAPAIDAVGELIARVS